MACAAGSVPQYSPAAKKCGSPRYSMDSNRGPKTDLHQIHFSWAIRHRPTRPPLEALFSGPIHGDSLLGHFPTGAKVWDLSKLLFGTFREPLPASGYTGSELNGTLKASPLALLMTPYTIGHSSDRPVVQVLNECGSVTDSIIEQRATLHHVILCIGL